MAVGPPEELWVSDASQTRMTANVCLILTVMSVECNKGTCLIAVLSRKRRDFSKRNPSIVSPTNTFLIVCVQESWFRRRQA